MSPSSSSPNARRERGRASLSLSSILLIPTICTTILSCLPMADAYIPAGPINDTSRLNMTDASTVFISWVLPAGVYQGPVSYQLQADVPTGGQTSGALVHFTESTMGPNASTSTPWIAYISCDVNETDASQEWDIFTLARDRGAISALLYSPTSQSCLLTEEYITDFEKPLDVFASETLQVARIIDSQFTNTNETFYYYNGTLLNSSSNAVNLSLAGTPLQERTFLIGTLTARNSTGQVSPTNIPQPTDGSSNDGKPRNGQPPAMIALYVVTGCISAMFALMIGMAARRAIRNPERYGRREGNENEAGQTRAGGIAQALLDTFPIIKFNRREAPKSLHSETELEFRQLPLADRERRRSSHPETFGLGANGGTATDRYSTTGRNMSDAEIGSMSYLSAPGYRGDGGDDDVSVKSVEPPSALAGAATAGYTDSELHLPGAKPDPSASALAADMPGDMEEQCPICLIDFETGDDLRVLPCEKEHSYHQTCIDPWLLDVSSSCPLCRKDFNQPDPAASTSAGTSAAASSSSAPPTSSGFAKYLAFMRREKRGLPQRRSRAGTGVSHTSSTVRRAGSGSGGTGDEQV